MSHGRKKTEEDSNEDTFCGIGINKMKGKTINTSDVRFYGTAGISLVEDPVKPIESSDRVYILTTKGRIKKNKYKVGSHKGLEKKLESRYVTPLIDPIICFFHYTEHARIVELTFKRLFIDDRIVNKKGVRTEWVIMDETEIIKWLIDIDETYQETLLDWDNY